MFAHFGKPTARAAHAARACIPLLFTAFPAAAAEVDLDKAGCSTPPAADRFMSVHLILDAEGNARDCVISADPADHCEQYHSFDEGFLCLGLTHNPRPDITAAETANSARIDRLVIDGEEVEESYGKTILRRDLGTGPSGETYNVVAEHRVGALNYALEVNVSAAPDGPVQFNSVSLSYTE